MKIGLVVGNLNNNRSGIGNYIYNLTNQLKKTENNELTIIGCPNLTLFKGIRQKSPFYPAIPFNTILWSQFLSFQKKVFSEFDVIHNPGHFPIFIRSGAKNVCTIHDITALLSPELHQPHRAISQKMSFPVIIRHADKIIADSHHTKKDLMRFFHTDDKKITVIHLGASPDYKQMSNQEINSIKTKYKLNFPFILSVGNLEPRKNIPTLLKAFSICKRKMPEIKLVIVGQKGWKYAEIFSTLTDLHLDNEVIFLHYIPHEDLPAIYNAAELFVYPSLYEGFGLPPLEAMQCGIPVITANTSSLPEIVGDGGIMVSPYDIHGLADMMFQLLSDDNLRKENIRYGLSRAQMFSWEKCAQQTQEVYEEVGKC